MADRMRLDIYDRELDHFLNAPKGEVGVGLMDPIGREILLGAQRMAGIETGDLKRKLYVKHYRRPRYQVIEVGSTSRHAYLHHEGTRPHLITPRTGRVLRFNVGGHVVYAKETLSPGTKPNPYLTTPMRRAVGGG